MQRLRQLRLHPAALLACARLGARSWLEWVESSGRGTLYSFSTVYRPQQPVFETPYTVVVVELDEGYHMLSNLIGVEPEDVEIGTPLEVFFEKKSDEITLPYFRVREA